MNSLIKGLRGVLLGFLILFAFQETGCGEQSSLVFETAASRGQAVYERNCKPCHEDMTLELRTKPPNLNGLFTKKALPSGAPATDEQVRRTIQQGRGIMPPFAQVLDKENLDDLIAYLHTKK
jgi:mono/diheme cytochrome c family protein